MCKWRRHFKLNVKLRQSQNKDSYERAVFGSFITKYVQRIWRSSRGGEDRNMLELYFILRPVLCGRTVDRLVCITPQAVDDFFGVSSTSAQLFPTS